MDVEKQGQDIVVQIVKNFKDADVSLPQLKNLVSAICNRFEISRATVGIAIVDDAQIRRINKQFLNRDWATDCLSFDLSDKGKQSPKSFELVVNAEEAAREASLRGHPAEAELALYVTHGLLHNLGFDDTAPDQAEKMHQTEDEILQQLGFGLVYNKSVKK